MLGRISMLSESEIKLVRDKRHSFRLNGCWGACYETSCFIEYQFGWRRRDGVYQLPDGTPVFRHSWNQADDGTIIDGTADQFFRGQDIAIFSVGDLGHDAYRDRYTSAHNPAISPWLAGRAYVGVPDDEYWEQRHEARMLGPGWWLGDNRDYLRWLLDGASRYWLFGAKVKSYRDLGYGGLSPET
jgi:hypothetical protein